MSHDISPMSFYITIGNLFPIYRTIYVNVFKSCILSSQFRCKPTNYLKNLLLEVTSLTNGEAAVTRGTIEILNL